MKVSSVLATFLIMPIALLAIVLAAFGINAFLDHRAGNAFVRIRMGATESEVVSLIGKSDTERPCGDNLWWGGDGDFRGRNDGRCVREVRYEYFLSAWALGTQRIAVSVSKYHYFSEWFR